MWNEWEGQCYPLKNKVEAITIGIVISEPSFPFGPSLLPPAFPGLSEAAPEAQVQIRLQQGPLLRRKCSSLHGSIISYFFVWMSPSKFASFQVWQPSSSLWNWTRQPCPGRPPISWWHFSSFTFVFTLSSQSYYLPSRDFRIGHKIFTDWKGR